MGSASRKELERFGGGGGKGPGPRRGTFLLEGRSGQRNELERSAGGGGGANKKGTYLVNETNFTCSKSLPM